MTNPSVPDYWYASSVVYGEYDDPDGFENALLNISLPSESTLLNDLSTYLAQNGLSGWTPLTVQYIPQDGFYGAAFLTSSGQIIIGFEGTTAGGSTYDAATIVQDKTIEKNQIPNALVDAGSFAAAVLVDASGPAGLGISSNQVFVTGHSLGGIEAEYVSSQLGLGGASFGATGLPGYVNPGSAPNFVNPGSPPNFVNYIDYGDPIGGFASNMPFFTGEPGFAYSSGMDHVGAVVMVGSPSNSVDLRSPTAFYTPLFGYALDLKYHYRENYAVDLGIFPVGSVPATSSILSPYDVLTTLDSALGTSGQQDLNSAILVSGDEVQSPNFTVTTNPANNTVTITQNHSLVDDSGAVSGDVGTDVITLDPSTFAVASEVFSDSVTGTSVELIPDVDAADANQNVVFSSGIQTIAIENASLFTGVISNFVQGDTIDLVGILATGAALTASNVLTVQAQGGETVSLNVASIESDQGFSVVSDGAGGTDILVGVPATNEAIFRGQTNGTATYLWKTDGTAAGTSEINVEGASSNGLTPFGFTAFGTEILFSGYDTSGKFSLWKTDGTAGGTSEIGGASPFGLPLVRLGGQVFFINFDSSTGSTSLWSTDGTTAGTHPLGVNFTNPLATIAFDGKIVVMARDNNILINGFGQLSLFETDGTQVGTSLVWEDVGNETLQGGNLTVLGNKLLFTTFTDSSFSAIGLFVSDGTSDGTHVLSVAGVSPDIGGLDPTDLTVFGNEVIFRGSGASNESDLWVTDGTSDGTRELSVAGGNAAGLAPSDFTVVGNVVWFFGVGADGTEGLWETDGTSAGTTELVPLTGSRGLPAPGDLTAVGDIALFNFKNSLWRTDGTTTGTTQVDPVTPAGITAFVGPHDVIVPCYLAGTLIATVHGDRRVEQLKPGDLMHAWFASVLQINWIGRRCIDCSRHPDPRKVWPVRVRAGAFDESAPRRDLWLSPDHAVFVDDVLIPIKHLINGCTITQEPRDEVTYFHIELAQHDVLLAEGLSAESYLDTGNRSNFENAGQPMRLHPDFSARMWEASGCAPLIVTGPILAAVRARLLHRAAKLASRPKSRTQTARAA